MSETNQFERVAILAELPPGSAKQVVVGGERVALFNVEGDVFAIGDTCTHEDASLAEGFVMDHEVECPRHGAMFDLKTGQALTLPATKPVPAYEVKIEGDAVWLRPSSE